MFINIIIIIIINKFLDWYQQHLVLVKGKGRGKNKGWNNNSWQDWKGTLSEGSTKASEWGDLSTTEWLKQNQQWKWPDQRK